MQDIYFNENYGKLYEKIEKGKSEIFKFENEDGAISNQFIIREIPEKIDGITYYDIITPYGYGGPIIERVNGDKKKLLEEYEKSFSKYCENNNIVSDFVRFHPIINNAEDFKDIYEVCYIRNTLGTNLKISDDPISDEFSKSCRKTIRQVLKKGITFNVIEDVKDFEEFKRIYYLNMDRKKATDYYYFNDEYFNLMDKYFHKNLIQMQAIYNNKVIAEGLYFVYNKTIHAHLSGTDTEYLYLSPAYILKYGTAIWGKQHGYELIHYGGGTSNSEDDPLYIFKKKFSQNTEFKFYIGKKIWNSKIYDELCQKSDIKICDDFFPAYRKDRR